MFRGGNFLFIEERIFCILSFKAKQGKDVGKERARLEGRGWFVKVQLRNIEERDTRRGKSRFTGGKREAAGALRCDVQ